MKNNLLFTETLYWPFWVYLVIFLPIIPLAVYITNPGMLMVCAFSLLPGAAVVTAFFCLKTTVTHEHVQFGFTIFKKTISLDSIISIDSVTYSWIEFGGFGIKYSHKQKAAIYNIIGDSGKAVKIEYQSDRIKTAIFVSSLHPSEFVQAVIQAKNNTAC